jgi:hypothetical protein
MAGALATAHVAAASATSGRACLARYFQHSVTDIPPERLVDHVATLLGRALLAAA